MAISESTPFHQESLEICFQVTDIYGIIANYNMIGEQRFIVWI